MMAVEEAIRSCFVQQERHLQIKPILGLLFQNHVISAQDYEEIRAVASPLEQRQILLHRLIQVDDGTLLTYCRILDESAVESGLPAHREIAHNIRERLRTSNTHGMQPSNSCSKSILTGSTECTSLPCEHHSASQSSMDRKPQVPVKHIKCIEKQSTGESQTFTCTRKCCERNVDPSPQCRDVDADQYPRLQLLVDLFCEAEHDGWENSCEECCKDIPTLPARIDEQGILKSKSLHRLCGKMIGLSSEKSSFVLDYIIKENCPVDFRIQMVHSGCGDRVQHIPRLRQVLVMCKSADNPLILEFKIHCHLSWCYFGHDTEKFEEHYSAACQLSSFMNQHNSYLQLLVELQAVYFMMKMFSNTKSALTDIKDVMELVSKLFDLANRSSVKYNSPLYMTFARIHNMFIHLVAAIYHHQNGNVLDKVLHLGLAKESLLVLYADPGWKGLEQFANKAWFWKFLSLLNLPLSLNSFLKMAQNLEPEDLLNTHLHMFTVICTKYCRSDGMFAGTSDKMSKFTEENEPGRGSEPSLSVKQGSCNYLQTALATQSSALLHAQQGEHQETESKKSKCFTAQCSNSSTDKGYLKDNGHETPSNNVPEYCEDNNHKNRETFLTVCKDIKSTLLANAPAAMHITICLQGFLFILVSLLIGLFLLNMSL